MSAVRGGWCQEQSSEGPRSRARQGGLRWEQGPASAVMGGQAGWVGGGFCARSRWKVHRASSLQPQGRGSRRRDVYAEFSLKLEFLR